MTDVVRRHRALLALLGAGLAWRVVLAYVVFPAQGYASDLGLYWQWAQSLAAGGPGAFYASTGSANYPPLYLYVLWPLGIIGQPALLKLPAILADVGDVPEVVISKSVSTDTITPLINLSASPTTGAASYR